MSNNKRSAKMNDQEFIDDENLTPANKKKKNDSIDKTLPLKNLSVKANKSFKSPILVKSGDTKNLNTKIIDENRLVDEIKTLEDKIDKIDKDIESLKEAGIIVNDYETVIEKLHIFNEIKDVAQIIMGKIAEYKRITIKEIHKQFDADLNDN